MCQECDNAKKNPSRGVEAVGTLLSQMLLHPVMASLVIRLEEIYGAEIAREIVLTGIRSVADKLEKAVPRGRVWTQVDTSVVDNAIDGIVDAVFTGKKGKGRKKR